MGCRVLFAACPKHEGLKTVGNLPAFKSRWLVILSTIGESHCRRRDSQMNAPLRQSWSSLPDAPCMAVTPAAAPVPKRLVYCLMSSFRPHSLFHHRLSVWS